jgi:hypothetical protein
MGAGTLKRHGGRLYCSLKDSAPLRDPFMELLGSHAGTGGTGIRVADFEIGWIRHSRRGVHTEAAEAARSPKGCVYPLGADDADLAHLEL